MNHCSKCRTANNVGARFCRSCGASLVASHRLATGTVLEKRYAISHKLGEGGFGAVYLAKDARLKRACVVKYLLIPAGTSQPDITDLRRTFEREADALIGLNHPGHPNIPEIYDFFSDADGNYLVMKYIEGQTLEQRQQSKGNIPWWEAVRFVVAVANALAYMHSQRPPVLHRDIKPANILIDSTERIWLVDFGLSKAQPLAGGKAGLSEPMGTPGYAPPEQHQKGGAEHRSDVYALAATFYHLVTGDDPGSHPFSFPQLNQLPATVSKVIGPALSSELEKRPDANTFCQQLQNTINPTTTAVPLHFRSGATAHNADELVQACLRHWEDGKYHLYRQDFERHLRQWGRTDLEGKAAETRRQHQQQDKGLDAFLRMVDSNFPAPKLHLSETHLDAGVIAWKGTHSLTLTLSNRGAGCLSGQINNVPHWITIPTLQSSGPFPQSQDPILTRLPSHIVSPPQTSSIRFDIHQQQQIVLNISTAWLSPRTQPYTATLTVETNRGGKESLTVQVVVTEPQLTISPGQVKLTSTFEQSQPGQTISVENKGRSECTLTLSSDKEWLNTSTQSIHCRANSRHTFQVTADTRQISPGQQSAILRIQAAAGAWQKKIDLPILTIVPWVVRLRQIWGASVVWATWSVVWALLGFSLLRLPYFTHLVNPLVHSGNSWWMWSIIAIAGGWLGILGHGQPNRKIDLGGYLGIIMPWWHDFWGGLGGTVLFVLTIQTSLWADTWLGLAPALGLVVLISFCIGCLLHLPGNVPPPNVAHAWLAGLSGVLTALVLLFFLLQPRYWWRPTETFHVNSKRMAVITGGQVLSIDWGLGLWRVTDEQLLTTLAKHSAYVDSVAVTSDGRTMATGARDNIIRLWRVSDGQLLAQLVEHTGPSESFIIDVAFAPDGHTLASSSSGDHTVRLWRVSEGQLLATLQTGTTSRVMFSPDGKILATGSANKLQLWRVNDGQLLATLPIPSGGWIHNLAFAPDGQLLASGSSDGMIRLWRVGDGHLVATLKGHTDSVDAVAFAPDGQTLVSRSSDNTMRLWQVEKGKTRRLVIMPDSRSSRAHSVVFAPDSSLFFTTTIQGDALIYRYSSP
jgi:serine/threonine protein kinase